jgi:hypothetical protein
MQENVWQTPGSPTVANLSCANTPFVLAKLKSVSNFHFHFR